MTTHNNINLVKRFNDIFRLKSESAPTEVLNSFVPVVTMQPESDIGVQNSAFNATSAVILATPLDKDFFITSAQISSVKDATATATASSVTCVRGGAIFNILAVAHLTLTQEFSVANNAIHFLTPLKVDRGTNILVSNSTAVGNIRTYGVVYGFYGE